MLVADLRVVLGRWFGGLCDGIGSVMNGCRRCWVRLMRLVIRPRCRGLMTVILILVVILGWWMCVRAVLCVGVLMRRFGG